MKESTQNDLNIVSLAQILFSVPKFLGREVYAGSISQKKVNIWNVTDIGIVTEEPNTPLQLTLTRDSDETGIKPSFHYLPLNDAFVRNSNSSEKRTSKNRSRRIDEIHDKTPLSIAINNVWLGNENLTTWRPGRCIRDISDNQDSDLGDLDLSCKVYAPSLTSEEIGNVYRVPAVLCSPFLIPTSNTRLPPVFSSGLLGPGITDNILLQTSVNSARLIRPPKADVFTESFAGLLVNASEGKEKLYASVWNRFSSSALLRYFADKTSSSTSAGKPSKYTYTCDSLLTSEGVMKYLSAFPTTLELPTVQYTGSSSDSISKTSTGSSLQGNSTLSDTNTIINCRSSSSSDNCYQKTYLGDFLSSLHAYSPCYQETVSSLLKLHNKHKASQIQEAIKLYDSKVETNENVPASRSKIPHSSTNTKHDSVELSEYAIAAVEALLSPETEEVFTKLPVEFSKDMLIESFLFEPEEWVGRWIAWSDSGVFAVDSPQTYVSLPRRYHGGVTGKQFESEWGGDAGSKRSRDSHETEESRPRQFPYFTVPRKASASPTVVPEDSTRNNRGLSGDISGNIEGSKLLSDVLERVPPTVTVYASVIQDWVQKYLSCLSDISPKGPELTDSKLIEVLDQLFTMPDLIQYQIVQYMSRLRADEPFVSDDETVYPKYALDHSRSCASTITCSKRSAPHNSASIPFVCDCAIAKTPKLTPSTLSDTPYGRYLWTQSSASTDSSASSTPTKVATSNRQSNDEFCASTGALNEAAMDTPQSKSAETDKSPDSDMQASSSTEAPPPGSFSRSALLYIPKKSRFSEESLGMPHVSGTLASGPYSAVRDTPPPSQPRVRSDLPSRSHSHSGSPSHSQPRSHHNSHIRPHSSSQGESASAYDMTDSFISHCTPDRRSTGHRRSSEPYNDPFLPSPLRDSPFDPLSPHLLMSNVRNSYLRPAPRILPLVGNGSTSASGWVARYDPETQLHLVIFSTPCDPFGAPSRQTLEHLAADVPIALSAWVRLNPMPLSPFHRENTTEQKDASSDEQKDKEGDESPKGNKKLGTNTSAPTAKAGQKGQKEFSPRITTPSTTPSRSASAGIALQSPLRDPTSASTGSSTDPNAPAPNSLYPVVLPLPSPLQHAPRSETSLKFQSHDPEYRCCWCLGVASEEAPLVQCGTVEIPHDQPLQREGLSLSDTVNSHVQSSNFFPCRKFTHLQCLKPNEYAKLRDSVLTLLRTVVRKTKSSPLPNTASPRQDPHSTSNPTSTFNSQIPLSFAHRDDHNNQDFPDVVGLSESAWMVSILSSFGLIYAVTQLSEQDVSREVVSTHKTTKSPHVYVSLSMSRYLHERQIHLPHRSDDIQTTTSSADGKLQHNQSRSVQARKTDISTSILVCNRKNSEVCSYLFKSDSNSIHESPHMMNRRSTSNRLPVAQNEAQIVPSPRIPSHTLSPLVQNKFSSSERHNSHRAYSSSVPCAMFTLDIQSLSARDVLTAFPGGWSGVWDCESCTESCFHCSSSSPLGAAGTWKQLGGLYKIFELIASELPVDSTALTFATVPSKTRDSCRPPFDASLLKIDDSDEVDEQSVPAGALYRLAMLLSTTFSYCRSTQGNLFRSIDEKVTCPLVFPGDITVPVTFHRRELETLRQLFLGWEACGMEERGSVLLYGNWTCYEYVPVPGDTVFMHRLSTLRGEGYAGDCVCQIADEFHPKDSSIALRPEFERLLSAYEQNANSVPLDLAKYITSAPICPFQCLTPTPTASKESIAGSSFSDASSLSDGVQVSSRNSRTNAMLLTYTASNTLAAQVVEACEYCRNAVFNPAYMAYVDRICARRVKAKEREESIQKKLAVVAMKHQPTHSPPAKVANARSSSNWAKVERPKRNLDIETSQALFSTIVLKSDTQAESEKAEPFTPTENSNEGPTQRFLRSRRSQTPVNIPTVVSKGESVSSFESAIAPLLDNAKPPDTDLRTQSSSEMSESDALAPAYSTSLKQCCGASPMHLDNDVDSPLDPPPAEMTVLEGMSIVIPPIQSNAPPIPSLAFSTLLLHQFMPISLRKFPNTTMKSRESSSCLVSTSDDVKDAHVEALRQFWQLFDQALMCYEPTFDYDGPTRWKDPKRARYLFEPHLLEPVSITACGPCYYRQHQERSFCPTCYGVYRSETTCMIACDHCKGWVHVQCEGLRSKHLDDIDRKEHPYWSDAYLCVICRREKMDEVIQEVSAQDTYQVFQQPVTEVVAPGYSNVISNPIDLYSIQTRFLAGVYTTPGENGILHFFSDLERIVRNALVFNAPQGGSGDTIYTYAWTFLYAIRKTFRNRFPMFRVSYVQEEFCDLEDSALKLKVLPETTIEWVRIALEKDYWVILTPPAEETPLSLEDSAPVVKSLKTADEGKDMDHDAISQIKQAPYVEPQTMDLDNAEPTVSDKVDANGSTMQSNDSGSASTSQQNPACVVVMAEREGSLHTEADSLSRLTLANETSAEADKSSNHSSSQSSPIPTNETSHGDAQSSVTGDIENKRSDGSAKQATTNLNDIDPESLRPHYSSFVPMRPQYPPLTFSIPRATSYAMHTSGSVDQPFSLPNASSSSAWDSEPDTLLQFSLIKICNICHSSGNPDYLLTCNICGDVSHIYCASPLLFASIMRHMAAITPSLHKHVEELSQLPPLGSILTLGQHAVLMNPKLRDYVRRLHPEVSSPLSHARTMCQRPTRKTGTVGFDQDTISSSLQGVSAISPGNLGAISADEQWMNSVERFRNGTWTCSNCSCCPLCGVSATEKDSFACQLCHTLVHIRCLSFSNTIRANTNLFCLDCVDCVDCGRFSNTSNCHSDSTTTSLNMSTQNSEKDQYDPLNELLVYDRKLLSENFFSPKYGRCSFCIRRRMTSRSSRAAAATHDSPLPVPAPKTRPQAQPVDVVSNNAPPENATKNTTPLPEPSQEAVVLKKEASCIVTRDSNRKAALGDTAKYPDMSYVLNHPVILYTLDEAGPSKTLAAVPGECPFCCLPTNSPYRVQCTFRQGKILQGQVNQFLKRKKITVFYAPKSNYRKEYADPNVPIGDPCPKEYTLQCTTPRCLVSIHKKCDRMFPSDATATEETIKAARASYKCPFCIFEASTGIRPAHFLPSFHPTPEEYLEYPENAQITVSLANQIAENTNSHRTRKRKPNSFIAMEAEDGFSGSLVGRLDGTQSHISVGPATSGVLSRSTRSYSSPSRSHVTNAASRHRSNSTDLATLLQSEQTRSSQTTRLSASGQLLIDSVVRQWLLFHQILTSLINENYAMAHQQVLWALPLFTSSGASTLASQMLQVLTHNNALPMAKRKETWSIMIPLFRQSIDLWRVGEMELIARTNARTEAETASITSITVPAVDPSAIKPDTSNAAEVGRLDAEEPSDTTPIQSQPSPQDPVGPQQATDCNVPDPTAPVGDSSPAVESLELPHWDEVVFSAMDTTESLDPQQQLDAKGNTHSTDSVDNTTTSFPIQSGEESPSDKMDDDHLTASLLASLAQDVPIDGVTSPLDSSPTLPVFEGEDTTDVDATSTAPAPTALPIKANPQLYSNEVQHEYGGHPSVHSQVPTISNAAASEDAPVTSPPPVLLPNSQPGPNTSNAAREAVSPSSSLPCVIQEPSKSSLLPIEPNRSRVSDLATSDKHPEPSKRLVPSKAKLREMLLKKYLIFPSDPIARRVFHVQFPQYSLSLGVIGAQKHLITHRIPNANESSFVGFKRMRDLGFVSNEDKQSTPTVKRSQETLSRNKTPQTLVIFQRKCAFKFDRTRSNSDSSHSQPEKGIRSSSFVPVFHSESGEDAAMSASSEPASNDTRHCAYCLQSGDRMCGIPPKSIDGLSTPNIPWTGVEGPLYLVVLEEPLIIHPPRSQALHTKSQPPLQNLAPASAFVMTGDRRLTDNASLLKAKPKSGDLGFLPNVSSLSPVDEKKSSYAWAHVLCALWSTDVMESESGELMNVGLSIAEAQRHKCTFCHSPGASITCEYASSLGCKSRVHLRCALRLCVPLLGKKVIICGCHENQPLYMRINSYWNGAIPTFPLMKDLSSVYSNLVKQYPLLSYMHPIMQTRISPPSRMFSESNPRSQFLRGYAATGSLTAHSQWLPPYISMLNVKPSIDPEPIGEFVDKILKEFSAGGTVDSGEAATAERINANNATAQERGMQTPTKTARMDTSPPGATPTPPHELSQDPDSADLKKAPYDTKPEQVLSPIALIAAQYSSSESTPDTTPNNSPQLGSRVPPNNTLQSRLELSPGITMESTEPFGMKATLKTTKQHKHSLHGSLTALLLSLRDFVSELASTDNSVSVGSAPSYLFSNEYSPSKRYNPPPLRVGTLTVLEWGELCPFFPGGCNASQLYPIGYKAKKIWWGPRVVPCPIRTSKTLALPILSECSYTLEILPPFVHSHNFRRQRTSNNSTLQSEMEAAVAVLPKEAQKLLQTPVFRISCDVYEPLRFVGHSPDAVFSKLRHALYRLIGKGAAHMLSRTEHLALHMKKRSRMLLEPLVSPKNIRVPPNNSAEQKAIITEEIANSGDGYTYNGADGSDKNLLPVINARKNAIDQAIQEGIYTLYELVECRMDYWDDQPTFSATLPLPAQFFSSHSVSGALNRKKTFSDMRASTMGQLDPAAAHLSGSVWFGLALEPVSKVLETLDNAIFMSFPSPFPSSYDSQMGDEEDDPIEQLMEEYRALLHRFPTPSGHYQFRYRHFSTSEIKQAQKIWSDLRNRFVTKLPTQLPKIECSRSLRYDRSNLQFSQPYHINSLLSVVKQPVSDLSLMDVDRQSLGLPPLEAELRLLPSIDKKAIYDSCISLFQPVLSAEDLLEDTSTTTSYNVLDHSRALSNVRSHSRSCTRGGIGQRSVSHSFGAPDRMYDTPQMVPLPPEVAFGYPFQFLSSYNRLGQYGNVVYNSNVLCVRRSLIHGWGLFLKTGARQDDVLIEYAGLIVRQATADRREIIYEQESRRAQRFSHMRQGSNANKTILAREVEEPGESDKIPDSLSMFSVPQKGNASDGSGSCYLFRLDESSIVDATLVGCVARFINHRCEPNSYSKVITQDGVAKIVICAVTDLKKGEELTYNYKFAVETDPALKVPCFCGAPGCKGTMN